MVANEINNKIENPETSDGAESQETPGTPNKHAWPWYYLEIPDFYDRVRFNLGTNISIIPDDAINYYENAPMAEMQIKQRVPNWKELDKIKTALFQTCIIYMTCYKLCPIVSSTGKVLTQKTPALELTFANNTNQDKPCERFLALIDDLIAQINDTQMQSFFGFQVTKEYPECGCKQVWDGWNKDNKNAFNPLGSE